MSRELYEKCPMCNGDGKFHGGVTYRFEPGDLGRLAALADKGLCPGCEGRCYLPIGLTVRQVEKMTEILEDLRTYLGLTRHKDIPAAVREMRARLATTYYRN
jgi:hypothetical protein